MKIYLYVIFAFIVQLMAIFAAVTAPIFLTPGYYFWTVVFFAIAIYCGWTIFGAIKKLEKVKK